MANLNLSQFGENTSVSNADYTFVWDSANSISKKVSRNSWLTSGTLTSDAPVTISQTWNAGSNVMTALKVVATDTASGATSNLLELWAGSTPALDFAVTKAGVMQAYGTYSSAGANYARLALACDSSGNATISTQALGTGTAGTVSINGVPVGLGKGNVSSNVAVGFQVLNANTSGLANTGFGYASLQNTAGGSGNSGVGFAALQFNTSGNTNSGFGQNALNANTSGNSNTGIGVNSFFSNTTGSFNLAIGFSAGRFITGGSTANALANNSIYLGADTKAAASGETNQIVIGYDATGIGSNSVVLGNDSITKTALKGNVGIGTTSPTSKLDVAGVITVSDIYPAPNVCVSSNDGFNIHATGTGVTVSGVQLAAWTANEGAWINSAYPLSWGTSRGNKDTVIQRDGEADHLAMRRSTNGQKFSVYGTYPGAAWERFTITAPTSGNVLLGTYKGTGGIARGLELQADGTTRMLITAAGAIIQRPLASVTPPDNGDLVVEATSNTTLTFKLKGTDGTVRSGTITLA